MNFHCVYVKFFRTFILANCEFHHWFKELSFDESLFLFICVMKTDDTVDVDVQSLVHSFYMLLCVL